MDYKIVDITTGRHRRCITQNMGWVTHLLATAITAVGGIRCCNSV